MQDPTKPKKLLEQVRDTLRIKHYSYRAEQTYLEWIRRFILFHHKRHPQICLNQNVSPRPQAALNRIH